MSKSKRRHEVQLHQLRPRKINSRDRRVFCHQRRSLNCLFNGARKLIKVITIDHDRVKTSLAFQCNTIEHQIIALRGSIQLTPEDYEQRCVFTSLFLKCLAKHHGIAYEGIIFGSTVNGLGFRDSDVDLRLRPLLQVGQTKYEPMILNDEMVERILRNIAHQTTLCCLCKGEFVPSTRCPIAKLNFIQGGIEQLKDKKYDVEHLKKGIKYDISLSSSNPLATFNSRFLRFLCHLEPRFHLLATVLRYWSNAHELIVPGYLSSYALVNMLIFFCQIIEPPLLPSIDQMRDAYFQHCAYKSNIKKQPTSRESSLKGLTQLEWHCLLCFHKIYYPPSANTEPLSVLLLKFFEFYLNFPYSSHIITTRPGRTLTQQEFQSSTQYHVRFPMNTFLNIQDPFDLTHNLTAGMRGPHFKRILVTIKYSYERLFQQLLNNFTKPKKFHPNITNIYKRGKPPSHDRDLRDWGLNVLFNKLTKKEYGEEKESTDEQELRDGEQALEKE